MRYLTLTYYTKADGKIDENGWEVVKPETAVSQDADTSTTH
jgi:hypothetical protein